MRRLFLIGTVLLLASCAGRLEVDMTPWSEDYLDPTASLGGVFFQEDIAGKPRTLFYIRLSNENKVPLKITSAEYRISIDGGKSYQAVSSRALTLPAYGYASHNAEAVISDPVAFQRLRTIALAGNYDYRFKGTLTANIRREEKFDSVEKTFPIQASGTVKFKAAPAGAPGSLDRNVPAGMEAAPVVPLGF